MNELATKKFENQSLAKATEEIIRLQKNVNQSLISVAGISGEVAKSESYKDDGFKSAQEWLMSTFNYKKSTAYTMVKIGKNYVNLEIDGCVPIYKTIFGYNKIEIAPKVYVKRKNSREYQLTFEPNGCPNADRDLLPVLQHELPEFEVISIGSVRKEYLVRKRRKRGYNLNNDDFD